MHLHFSPNTFFNIAVLQLLWNSLKNIYLWWSAIFRKFPWNTLQLWTTAAEKIYFITALINAEQQLLQNASRKLFLCLEAVIRDVPLNKSSEKFCKFDSKTPVLESVDLQTCNFIKKDSNTGAFKVFKNTFFYRTPFYSDCFCVFWKSGESFSLQQLRKCYVGRQQLYREIQCRHSSGSFLKLINNIHSCFCCFHGLFEILNYTIFVLHCE